MIKLRVRSTTSIQYILLTVPSEFLGLNTPPSVFNNNVIPFLKRAPQDLFQFHSSFGYIENFFTGDFSGGHDFKIIQEENLNSFLPTILESKLIKLFFIDTAIKDSKLVYDRLYQGNMNRHWFHFHEKGKNLNLSLPGEVISPSHFRKLLFENQSEILSLIESTLVEITPSINIDYKDFNEEFKFTPTHNNHFQIDSIIGNFLYDDSDTDINDNGSKSSYTDEEVKELSEASIKAQNEPSKWTRQNYLLSQIDKIDSFRRFSFEENLIIPATIFEPRLASLKLNPISELII